MRVLIAGVRDVDLHSFGAIAQPFEVFVAVGSIDDDEVVVPGHPINEDVVDEAGGRIEQAVVLRAAVLEFRDIVARRALQKCERFRAFDENLAHMRHVEKAGARAHGLVLVDDARELNGQFPPPEIDHLAA